MNLCGFLCHHIDSAHGGFRSKRDKYRSFRLADIAAVYPNSFFARTTMLRPSGVSSAREDKARLPQVLQVTPSAGINSVAILLPRVIVPVLSRSTVFTSPSFYSPSAHCHDIMRRSLSMPAMPIAGRSPPIVVASDKREEKLVSELYGDIPMYFAKAGSVNTTTMKQNRQADQQYFKGYFIRGLLSFRAFNHFYHVIEKSLTGIYCNSNFDFS